MTTIARFWQAGFETADNDEIPVRGTPNNLVADSSSPKTGSYALRVKDFSSDVYARINGLSASHVRVGLFWMATGIAGESIGTTPCPYIVRITDDTGDVIGGVRCSPSWMLFLEVAGSRVATGSRIFSAANGVEDYVRIGVDWKVAASGWAAVYVDGILELLYEGDTTGTGSRVESVYVPYLPTNSLGAQYFWIDDVYVDTVDGASAYESPPDRRFLPIPASSAGASSNWDVTGASVNVEAVDDWASGTADDSATYVSSFVPSAVDFYYGQEIAASTIAASNSIEALIVVARAEKTNSAASTQLRLAVRRGPGASLLSPGKDLEGSWGIVWHRFTEDPSTGSPWADYTAVNEAEMGIFSEP